MTQMLYADRSERGKLRFSGPQDRWFLHQILTQAVEDMEVGDARDAALITAHGRMQGYLELLATDDGLLAHFEPELRASLPDEIRRYVFATQVDIEELDDWGLFLVTGEDIGALDDVVVHPTTSLGIPAAYLWTRSPEKTVAALEELGAVEAGEDRLEAIRIENGVARWGREMDHKTFPQEADVAERAVHFDKGCYVGQEAMAKIQFRGKVNRRLARLVSDAPLEARAELKLDDKVVGTVTSAADNKALAIVRYTVETGTRLTAGDLPVEVVG